MQTPIRKQSRLSQKTLFKRFQATVKENVDHGFPLLWSVIVGKVVEEPPINGMGGHMRLIVGYNPKTSELIYSDSWGPGHERKRMSYGDAWTITMSMATIVPRRMNP